MSAPTLFPSFIFPVLRQLRPVFVSPSATHPVLYRTFSSTTRKMSTPAFFDAVKSRRTYYALSNTSPVPDARIIELVQDAVKHSPSAFNSQSSRAVVLIGKEHEKLWNITKEAVKAVAPPEAWEGTEKRLNGFQGAYGTVLLYEDRSVVSQFQKNIPTYASMFPDWSQHAHGILAFNIWVGLEAEGLGANLQHYGNLIDTKVAANWSIPETWALQAQLVFGKIEAPAGEKKFASIEERVKVFGA